MRNAGRSPEFPRTLPWHGGRDGPADTHTTMKFKDHYRTMGVTPGATDQELKTAYRVLARKYHPDVNKAAGTELRFSELVEAHEVLADPQRRAAYDQLRAAGWQEGQEMDPPQARGPAPGSRRRAPAG